MDGGMARRGHEGEASREGQKNISVPSGAFCSRGNETLAECGVQISNYKLASFFNSPRHLCNSISAKSSKIFCIHSIAFFPFRNKLDIKLLRVLCLKQYLFISM